MNQRLKLSSSEDHHHDHCHNHEEDEELFLFTPENVFFPENCLDAIPDGYTAVKIDLDGTINSDLSWNDAKKIALSAVESGKRILWHINLGLFSSLKEPLSNKAQFLSLTLSLEHFRDTLWQQFRSQTVGLCLYSGSADFSIDYPWDDNQYTNFLEWVEDNASLTTVEIANIHPQELSKTVQGKLLLQLFCRDSLSEYLELLARTLPDTIPLFLLFDAAGLQDPCVMLQLLHRDRFRSFQLALKGVPRQIVCSELVWNNEGLQVMSIDTIHLGLCLAITGSTEVNDRLRKAITNLCAEDRPFRVISSTYLTAEWDGIDDLIVDSETVDRQLFRKLQGFCAAGGRVLTIGKPLGLPNEEAYYLDCRFARDQGC